MKKYSIVLFFIAFICSYVFSSVISAELDRDTYIPSRYRIEGFNELFWYWTDEIPYIVLEEMCWNPEEGFSCDQRIENDENVSIINRITDFENGYTGIVYGNSYGCWLWWWEQHHDEINNPHPAMVVWIECPQNVVFENE